MAGHGGTWGRRPSPERQTAEATVLKLAAALRIRVAVDFEWHQIVSERREEQRRLRVEKHLRWQTSLELRDKSKSGA